MKNLGSCNRYKGRIYAKEGEGVSIVKGRERGGTRVHSRTIEERVYQTLKVASNGTSVFIEKKNSKKRMVQDYRYLNEWTIKNNYPLPLILDIVENIGIKKVFTKMDLR